MWKKLGQYGIDKFFPQANDFLSTLFYYRARLKRLFFHKVFISSTNTRFLQAGLWVGCGLPCFLWLKRLFLCGNYVYFCG